MLFAALQDRGCLPHSQKKKMPLSCTICPAAARLQHGPRTMLASSILMCSTYSKKCANTASEASPTSRVMRATSKWLAVSKLDLYLRAAPNFGTSLSKVRQSCVHLARTGSMRGVLPSEWNRGTQHAGDSNAPAPRKSLPQQSPQPPSPTTPIAVACATAACSALPLLLPRGPSAGTCFTKETVDATVATAVLSSQWSKTSSHTMWPGFQ